MNKLSYAQLGWLADHPHYCLVGPPSDKLKFYECGTLYANGNFELMAPMKVVKLEIGCCLIGIPSDLYLTDGFRKL